jgi:hypothetical protein
MCAIAAAACVDLSSPKGLPASISQIQLPAFFVVQGDTMRDTLGRTVPPSIIAFDGNGGVLTSFTPKFFITDSLQPLQFSALDGSLVATGLADTAGSIAHVVGQIGTLQTAVQTVYVTVRPDTLERSDTTTLNIGLSLGKDSASALTTLSLPTVVHGIGARAVPGVFVRYTLESSPAGTGSSPVAYLTDDAGNVFPAGKSTPDTGDASGGVSRTLVLNSFLATSHDELLKDTLSVIATALYKGVPLQGSPLRLRVLIVPSFSSVR